MTAAPLRVCIDARLPKGEWGGVESVVIGLVSALSRLPDGDETYLFLVDAGEGAWLRPYLDGRGQILEGRPRTHRPQWKAIRNRAAIRAIRRFLEPLAAHRPIRPPRSDGTVERAGAEVIHFPIQSAFLTDLPSIYHPHDLQHRHLPQFFTARQIRARDILYRAFCWQASVVAVAASWIKRDLIRQYELPGDKVHVVPLPPVLTAYPIPRVDDLIAVRQKFSLPEAFLFYPAQTWPHKNHLRLLEALAALRERDGLTVPLVCCGRRNEFYPTIEQRVRELGLAAQVQFLDFVQPLELQCLYRLCRGVVIATKFDATSLPLWEAFLAGVPAACSNVTALPDQAGDAALLFDPDLPEAIASTLRRLWTDSPLRARLIERGRRNVARFSWNRTARLFRAHYRRIADRPLTDEDRSLLVAPPLL